jgi:hypothetical protein
VIAVPSRRRADVVLGSTLETLLRERPCRVIIESRPIEQPAKRPVAA